MNRYYYSLTPFGRTFYATLKAEYETVQAGVALILRSEEERIEEPVGE